MYSERAILDRIERNNQFISRLRNPVPQDEGERRQKLTDQFKQLYDKHGRNFLNSFRSHFSIDLMNFLEINDLDYCIETTLEFELGRFAQLLNRAESSNKVDWYFYNIGDLLAKKDRIADKCGRSIEKKGNWTEWGADIEKRCANLNQEFGGLYRDCLYAFLYPVNDVLMLKPNDNCFIPDKKLFTPPKTETEKNDNFEKVIEWVTGYKESDSCGYFFSILDHWLANIEVSKDSLPEAITLMSLDVDNKSEDDDPEWEKIQNELVVRIAKKREEAKETVPPVQAEPSSSQDN